MTLVDNMRKADVEECVAGGFTPRQAVDLSIQLSDESFTYYTKSGEVIAQFGWAYDSHLLGSVRMWLLTTNLVDSNKVMFARSSKLVLAALMGKFRSIRCDVYQGHKDAIRWLLWLGFEFERVRCHGPLQEPFYVMVKERD